MAVLLVALFALLVLVSAMENAPVRKPDPAHIAIVMQKQSEWLEQHPVLLKISRSKIAGVPGDLLTSAYWHLRGAVTNHPRGAASGGAKQAAKTSIHAKQG